MLNSVKRPTAFILAPSNHGMMIVNRFDYQMVSGEPNRGYGVGFQILNTQSFDQEEVDDVLRILNIRRAIYGDGVVALDCGANIGVHTIEWAKHMYNWGNVSSFEPQEKIFYALAGNITLNNCFNVKANNVALGDENGKINIPQLNHFKSSSFGSFELEKNENNEFIGQTIDYNKTSEVRIVTIDSFEFKRVDLIKIDVEGMEEKVLKGAKKTIQEQKPIIVVEKIKSNQENLKVFFKNHNYNLFDFGLNFLCISNDDKCSGKIKGLQPII
jgi:FkbM family methyltransferase